jgi:hypothetical protein
MKKETLEEAYNRISKELDFSEFDFASFKLGVKWQQTQDKNKYSEEDMKDMYDYGYNNYLPIDKAFEQLKKKL